MQLGIKPKDIAVQRVQDGRLVVEFVRPPEPHMRSLAGILGPSPGQPREPLDVDSAVAQSVAEEWRLSVAREAADRGVAASRPRTRRFQVIYVDTSVVIGYLTGDDPVQTSAAMAIIETRAVPRAPYCVCVRA